MSVGEVSVGEMSVGEMSGYRRLPPSTTSLQYDTSDTGRSDGPLMINRALTLAVFPHHQLLSSLEVHYHLSQVLFYS